MNVLRPAVVAAVLGLVAAVMPGGAAAQDHPLTCSVVQIYCFENCGKEAPPKFCSRYCTNRLNECLRTGNWLGRHGDVFTGVIRQ